MCGCRQSIQGHGSSSRGSYARGTEVAPRASVPLTYQGARALLIRGPATGTGYACYPGEILRVDALDAPHLLASGAFVRAG